MKQNLFTDLVKHLNELVKVYRHLLETVRREKQLLMKADMAALEECNKTKEKMLEKINELEQKWTGTCHQIQLLEGKPLEAPRLSDIAAFFGGAERDKLMQLRSVLNLLVQRISTVNKGNETLTNAALAHISGAMQSIKQTLNKNSNYEKKGKRSETTTETSGRLMSKNV
jgi:hypothetical protein